MAPRLALSLILLVAALATPACNTIDGIGQDLQALGSATSEAANEHNPEKPNEVPEGRNPYK
ncbi:MAG: entericidin A/B family lipoprotein [Planctomycetota bacterium]